MEHPRILVGITTYKPKDYMIDKCYRAVKEFDYPSDKYDVLIVDNTDDKGRYANQLKKRGFRKVEHVARGANSRVAINRSQNLIRRRFLEGDYEWLLMVESDLLPPKDTLKRLLGHKKTVVGSWYWIGTGNVRTPCIFVNQVINGFGGTRPLGIIRHSIDDNSGKFDGAEIMSWWNSGLRQCHGVGFGTTLIHRDVVQEFPFWTDERFDNKHSDVYFYLDLERANIPVFVDTNVEVPHFPTDWALVEDR